MSELLKRTDRLWSGEASTAQADFHPFAGPRLLEELAPGVAFFKAFVNVTAVKTDDGLVLVDYKTDEHLTNESMLHYREQLASYAELLNRATGQPVVERVVLHVPGNSAAVIDCD